jgi:hypothetical protein
MTMAKIIGIDLGTSNSAAALLEAGRPKIIPSAEGASLYGKAFPSVVAFTKEGHILVGEPARRQAISNPKGTIIKAKRKMGKDFAYEIYGKKYTPQQISAFILQKIKKDAEEVYAFTDWRMSPGRRIQPEFRKCIRGQWLVLPGVPLEEKTVINPTGTARGGFKINNPEAAKGEYSAYWKVDGQGAAQTIFNIVD